MNGEETIRPPNNTVRPLSYNKAMELDDLEKVDMVIFSGSPYIHTLWKIMETEIIRARDEAMDADPANQSLQVSLLTEARAMHRFYNRIRSMVELAVKENHDDIKFKALQEDMKDQEHLENIIFSQTTGVGAMPELS